MFATFNQRFGTLVWIMALLPVVVRGGRPERVTALALLIDLAAVIFSPSWNQRQQVQWGVLAGDAAILALLIWLQSVYRRRWIPAAIGVMSVNVLAHVPRMVDSTIRNWGYVTIVTVCGYVLLMVLLWGAFIERSDHAQLR